METIEFTYNSFVYKYTHNINDISGVGCISEIVDNDEYKLDNFININDKTIIDIGANTGVATIILAKQNPKSIVYSFEPDSEVFKLLEKNIEDNNLDNVKAFNMAIHTEERYLYISPLWSGGNTLVSDDELFKQYFKTDVRKVKINTISIDDFITQNNIDEIYLLKIDCEGSEFDFFLNSKLIFKTVSINNIVGEFHDFVYSADKNDTKSSELLNYCKDNIDGIVKICILVIETDDKIYEIR